MARGSRIAEEQGRPFTWLADTNRGAASICAAALRVASITQEDLASGYLCDPQGKSQLRILARRGIVLRLTRNQDKVRGFVNGALAVVWESLWGNAVFLARLLSTGNLVLVHPVEEDGAVLCFVLCASLF